MSVSAFARMRASRRLLYQQNRVPEEVGTMHRGKGGGGVANPRGGRSRGGAADARLFEGVADPLTTEQEAKERKSSTDLRNDALSDDNPLPIHILAPGSGEALATRPAQGFPSGRRRIERAE
mmetsp:Transcript_69264/g.184733  ORF Transcript_69264/g.184733 Transcript_69264/m.184733 type:complete len:122 (-) Transcript_69264:78-443(-)